MTVQLTDWAMDAHTAAEILGVPVETFRTWRKRHGLLSQGDWMGSGRRPAMHFEFRHLLQATVAQKLMSVGISADIACKAPHYGVFQQFINCEPVEIGFADGQVCCGGYSDDDVRLTFSMEKSGVKVAKEIASNIEANEGRACADAALNSFFAQVDAERARRSSVK